MNKLLFVLLIIALAAIGAFAQPAPGGDAGAGGPGGGNRGGGGGGFLGGSTGTMVNTAKGVFALRDGILVKFDLKTVKLQGNTLELFGPMPKRPEGDRRANAEAFRAWGAELAQRSAPAIMIPKDDALIIVIGTSFFRVNQDTMTVDVDKDFAGPGENAGNQGFQMPTAPAYLLTDTALFLLRSKEMVALNIKDGAVIGRTPLPEQMQPRPMGRGQGGGGNNGGGGGGNRGGGGGGGAADPPAK